MDPVSAIVAALVAGAAASVNAVATDAVKDTYQALKTLIADRYKRSGAITTVEEDPGSEAAKAAVTEALRKSGAGDDPDVQKGALELDRALEAMPAETRAVLEIHLKDLQAGRGILLQSLTSSGDTTLTAERVRTDGDFTVRDVSAGESLQKHR
jgi:hypothetical protein